MNMNRNYDCILEISGMGVKLLVGYSYKGNLYIIHALESTSAGLDKGQITDKEKMILGIKEVINSASKSLMFDLKDVNLVLPPLNIITVSETGLTHTVSHDSVVSTFDVDNALYMISQRVEREGFKIVDIHPTLYVYDNDDARQRFVENMVSKSLRINADVVLMNSSYYGGFIDVVKQAGLNVKRTVISTMGDIALLSTYSIPQQYVFIDFGGTLTSVVTASQGRVNKISTINFGSEDITKYLMNYFNIDYERATYLKKVHGLDEEPKFHFHFKEKFKISDLTMAIEKSLTPLVDFIKGFIAENNVEEFYPIIITGGGADLNNLVPYLSSIFQTKVTLYTPDFIGARNKSYTNCVGCLKYLDLYPKKKEVVKEKDFTLTRVDNRTNFDEEL